MNEVAIFGKKGSIAKYDVTENKPIWVGDLPSGHIPHIIGQYEKYVIVFSWTWFGSKMIHCFKDDSGKLLGEFTHIKYNGSVCNLVTIIQSIR